MTENDLPDAFGGFPELQRAYRNQRRFDVYSSLTDNRNDLAVRICISVFSDIFGTVNNPLIIVYSPSGIPLASGGGQDIGCTAI